MTVNRPKVLNALNTPTWKDLRTAFLDHARLAVDRASARAAATSAAEGEAEMLQTGLIRRS